MDIQRTKELLEVLAEGIDPLTGEVLPDNHVCNKGEIVRALHCEELDSELCRLFDEGMKKKELCAHFKRTSGAIESRLEKLGKI